MPYLIVYCIISVNSAQFKLILMLALGELKVKHELVVIKEIQNLL